MSSPQIGHPQSISGAPARAYTTPPPPLPASISGAQVGFGLGGAFDSQGGISGIFSAILGPVVGVVLEQVRCDAGGGGGVAISKWEEARPGVEGGGGL